jgi:hypothetical protein
MKKVFWYEEVDNVLECLRSDGAQRQCADVEFVNGLARQCASGQAAWYGNGRAYRRRSYAGCGFSHHCSNSPAPVFTGSSAAARADGGPRADASCRADSHFNSSAPTQIAARG